MFIYSNKVLTKIKIINQISMDYSDSFSNERYLIKWEQLRNAKSHLQHLSNFDELTIQQIWHGKVENIENLEYTCDAPLWVKMIFRFRNCKYSPSRFWAQIDPCNRQRMLNCFGIFDSKFEFIMEFMAWIKNGLGILDLKSLKLSKRQIESWEQNELVFFDELDTDIQNKLMNMYNAMISRFIHI